MRLIFAFVISLILSFSAFSQQRKPLAAEFSATTIDGEKFKLEDLRGYVVVLTFWSTKCPICESEIPHMNELKAKYKDKDVVFLGVTMENQAKVNAFLEKKSFDFVIVPNGFDLFLKYGDRDAKGNLNMGYPAYFLIDQNGELDLKASGWEKTSILDADIERLLAPQVAAATKSPK
jgi:peroxiredoxin